MGAEFPSQELVLFVECAGCSQCYSGQLIEVTPTGIVVGLDPERSNFFFWEQVKKIIAGKTTYTIKRVISPIAM